MQKSLLILSIKILKNLADKVFEKSPWGEIFTWKSKELYREEQGSAFEEESKDDQPLMNSKHHHHEKKSVEV